MSEGKVRPLIASAKTDAQIAAHQSAKEIVAELAPVVAALSMELHALKDRFTALEQRVRMINGGGNRLPTENR